MRNNRIDLFYQLIIYVLLFLIGLNLKTYAILFCYILAIFSFSYSKNDFLVPKVSLYVVLLAISILISQLINNTEITLNTILKLGVYPLMFFSFYSIGKKCLRECNDINKCFQIFIFMYFFFTLGNIAHMLLDLMITDVVNINFGRRVINDIWTGGTANATIVAGWGCLIPPIIIYAFEKKNKRKVVFAISLLMLLICTGFSLIFATRIILVNLIFVFIAFLILLMANKDIIISSSRIVRYLFGIIIIVLAVYKLTPYIISSNLFSRMSSDSLSLLNTNGRSEVTAYLLEHFTESIWGGEYFTSQYGLQQHNILFQMYDLYGIIPFILLGLMIIEGIKCTVDILRNKNIPKYEKRFLVLLFISLMLYYFEEPALTSNYIITSILYGYVGFVYAMQSVNKFQPHREI